MLLLLLLLMLWRLLLGGTEARCLILGILLVQRFLWLLLSLLELSHTSASCFTECLPA